jgi:23S rRNA pseudouridine1911/1915/1917 synthase
MKKDRPGEMFKVSAESTLMDWLSEHYPQSSRTSLKKMVINGQIYVNGVQQHNLLIRLKEGDSLVYRKSEILKNPHSPFRIIHVDDSIVVIDKPAGMLTYGEKGSSGTSAYKELKEYLQRRDKSGDRLFVVHRLDREVSGLLLFARTAEIQEELKENWQDFTKRYQALCEGVMKQKSGVIRSWLSEGRDFRVISGEEREGAKYAETSFRVLRVLDGNTLAELELVTGRKNQIRVQLADLGHPVIGDRRYGADARWERRIRLHSVYLRFRHPGDGTWMEFSSSLPRGFLELRPEHEKYK